jgi:hypothetical protein
MNTNEDIENQFCIIDDSNNIDKNDQIELINLNMKKKNIFEKDSIANKLKKSKSYPDETPSYLVKYDFKSYKIKKSFDCEQNSDIDNIINSNLDLHDNLIENKSTIKIFMGRLKKIYMRYKYCIFCNLTWLNKIDKMEVLNKLLTVCLHILIMAIFEIYFYFNYVVWIEKNEFLKQINNYFSQLDYIPLDSSQKQIIKYFINSNQIDYNEYLNYLYNQYINSLSLQKKILNKLLIKACTIAGSIGIIFIFLLIVGLFYRKKIKWNWIWIENLLMFLFLGIFEYFFFMEIIMNYNPITDAEIKYYVVDGIITYFNSTS